MTLSLIIKIQKFQNTGKDVAIRKCSIPSFEGMLRKHSVKLIKSRLEVLQINVGKLCNQTCNHCFVDAAPNRREIMDRTPGSLKSNSGTCYPNSYRKGMTKPSKARALRVHVKDNQSTIDIHTRTSL